MAEEDEQIAGEAEAEEALYESGSLKTPVLEYLYLRYKETNQAIVFQEDVLEAIDATNAALSKSNPANFLKDVVRKKAGNDWWPKIAKDARITARQRYGNRMVMEFIPYDEDQAVPFPDRFVPTAATPIIDVATASIPFLARTLGRREETWLTQIIVKLRIIESHLSLISPLGDHVRDVTHLQMGMKTQPEIDAAYVLTVGGSASNGTSPNRNVFVSCEAKQHGERILEDQIRTQVNEVLKKTKKLKAPQIHGVRPVAVQVLDFMSETLVYAVEFEEFDREEFDEKWANTKLLPDRIYSMPLVKASDALYRLRPSIKGVNA